MVLPWQGLQLANSAQQVEKVETKIEEGPAHHHNCQCYLSIGNLAADVASQDVALIHLVGFVDWKRMPAHCSASGCKPLSKWWSYTFNRRQCVPFKGGNVPRIGLLPVM